MKKPHLYTTLGLLTVAVLAFLFLPLPHSIICTLEVTARDAASVHVEVPGKLVAANVQGGEQVKKNDPLGRLEDVDLDIEIAKLRSSVAESRERLRSLYRQSPRDHRAAEQIPAVKDALDAFVEQLEEKEKDRDRLLLKAPSEGTVLRPLLIPHRDDPEEKLPMWSGTPLDPENIGAHLDRGTLFCQVGDPKKLEAVMVIDQADRNLINDRDLPAVDIKLEGYASTTIASKITKVAEMPLKVAPKRLSNKSQGELPTKTDTETGIERPMSTSYQASAPFDDPTGQCRVGLRGQARVYTKWISLGSRLWRLLVHTFNFKLGE